MKDRPPEYSMSLILIASEVAEYFHIHRVTVYRLARTGSLPGFRIAGEWRFALHELERWRAQQTDALQRSQH